MRPRVGVTSSRFRAVVLLVFSGVCVTAGADEPSSEFSRPELLAVTWTPMGPQPFNGPFVDAWRLDDTRIPTEELDWLRNSRKLKTYFTTPNSTRQLHPLVLVFKIDDRARVPQRLKATMLVDGKRIKTTGAALSTADHIATTSLAPRRTELGAWPAEIAVEILTPVGDPVVLYTLDAAKAQACTQDAPLQVETGVTWRSIPPNEQTNGKPAGVLSVDYEHADANCEWSAEITLSNRQLLHSSSTWSAGQLIEAMIKLDDPKSIERVTVSRSRFRVEKYEHVPTHPELIPK